MYSFWCFIRCKNKQNISVYSFYLEICYLIALILEQVMVNYSVSSVILLITVLVLKRWATDLMRSMTDLTVVVLI